MTIYRKIPLLLLAVSLCSQAALVPDRTRVIFNSKDKATSVKISNQSPKDPYLAYSWIEDEKGNKTDEYLTALPPIQRVNPSAATQVRIIKQDTVAQLPTDRETLFYYNLREIPPTPEKKSDAAILQIAVQSRIKLFWRPAALRKKTGERVELQLKVSQQGGDLLLENPTPYYLTIAYLGKDKKGVLPGFQSTMIAPFSRASTHTSGYSGNTFYLGYMDDYGALRMTTLSCQGNCTLTPVEATK
ncbi:molecular chaperone [Superficieibacter electus]|uniref:Molecular chaperone n=1 Tax=Superficieibacter electus TaxID=2022662 RepID=A0A2P5GR72_9ENTR|nr:molecular chaperone [Superficieibacter electus]POP42868.1 molecular chaperone [Superficieibacter electus]POP49073.1 molecular chaperone [Superficieibacter electus]